MRVGHDLLPAVHFAVSLGLSPSAARLSIWGVFGLYVLMILVPGLRRVSRVASMFSLVGTLVLVGLAMTFAAQIKQLVATAIGFYADSLPWSEARFAQPTWTYRNTFAGYSLQLPQTWEQTPGPIEGTTEIVHRSRERSEMAARLRPSCDVLEESVAMTVEAMLGEAPGLRRRCGYWRGLETCLLERGSAVASPSSPLHWEWLGRDRVSGMQMRLMFELFDERARADALAIIQSAVSAPASSKASACPNPQEWSEPFMPSQG